MVARFVAGLWVMGLAACGSSTAHESFSPTGAEFAGIWKGAKVLELPVALPQTGYRGMVINPADAMELVCGRGFYDCEEGVLYQVAGRVEVSPTVGTLFFEGMSASKPMVMMNYTAAGKAVSGRVVGGQLGRFGYSGTLGKDLHLVVSQFVGAGADKEYVKQETQRITASGELALVIR